MEIIKIDLEVRLKEVEAKIERIQKEIKLRKANNQNGEKDRETVIKNHVNLLLARMRKEYIENELKKIS